MSDSQYEQETSEYPEELTEILEPEIAEDKEEEPEVEAALPIPADLDLVCSAISGRRTALPS